MHKYKAIILQKRGICLFQAEQSADPCEQRIRNQTPEEAVKSRHQARCGNRVASSDVGKRQGDHTFSGFRKEWILSFTGRDGNEFRISDPVGADGRNGYSRPDQFDAQGPAVGIQKCLGCSISIDAWNRLKSCDRTQFSDSRTGFHDRCLVIQADHGRLTFCAGIRRISGFSKPRAVHQHRDGKIGGRFQLFTGLFQILQRLLIRHVHGQNSAGKTQFTGKLFQPVFPSRKEPQLIDVVLFRIGIDTSGVFGPQSAGRPGNQCCPVNRFFLVFLRNISYCPGAGQAQPAFFRPVVNDGSQSGENEYGAENEGGCSPEI